VGPVAPTLQLRSVLLITLDTNLIDSVRIDQLSERLEGTPHELAFVSVTERERGFEIGFAGRKVVETAVWGESPWGSLWGGPQPAPFVIGESMLAPDGARRYDVLGDDGDAVLFEASLVIIGNGSFPGVGEREQLTDGQRRQLRDAMIYTAHVRERRHVLVSNDQRAYVNYGKRERLENLGATKIRTSAELIAMADEGTLEELLPTVPYRRLADEDEHRSVG
jgi:hypothetical protein